MTGHCHGGSQSGTVFDGSSMYWPGAKKDRAMAVSFRLAKADQLSDIRSLYLTSMAYIGDRMGIERSADAFSDLESFVEARNLYIVQEDGVLLGAAAIREVDNGLYLEYLAVHQDHQNSGLGRKLLAEMEMIAESRELPYLRLHTPEVMHELLAYYARRGFTETHRALPPHGRDQVLRVYFEKDIAQDGMHADRIDAHDRQLA